MRDGTLDAFVERLKPVPGIVAIVVGGSRARGTADTSSDTDLGLYYHRHCPLNVAALDAVATECRETGKVEGALDNAINGQIEMAYQPGHPFGFLSSIYVGEVALCQPLWDPGHWVAKAKAKTDGYPQRLRRELVRRFVFEADFSLLIADKPSNRSDATYVAGCLFRSIGCVLQILFALNREHWMNEKGALALADRFDLVPPRFKERVERAWQLLEPNPSSLREAIRTLHDLKEEVSRLVRQEGMG